VFSRTATLALPSYASTYYLVTAANPNANITEKFPLASATATSTASTSHLASSERLLLVVDIDASEAAWQYYVEVATIDCDIADTEELTPLVLAQPRSGSLCPRGDQDSFEIVLPKVSDDADVYVCVCVEFFVDV
jgi:hypothetical protein